MTRILEKRKREASASSWSAARRIRRVCGWVLAAFLLVGFATFFRGLVEPALPGWAFYSW